MESWVMVGKGWTSLAEVIGLSILTLVKGGTGVRTGLNQSIDTAMAFVETKDLDLGAYEFRKWIQKIITDIKSRTLATNLKLIIKYRNNLDDALVSSSSIALNGADQVSNVSNKVQAARFYRLRFEDSGVSVLWELSKIELHGTLAGKLF